MDSFRTFYDFTDLKEHLKDQGPDCSVGLIPTMGALHEGHLSLVKRAIIETDIVVLTIFVNPKQFNKKSDLQTYPRTIENDIALLSTFEKLIVCIPKENEVYPFNDPYPNVDLGNLNDILEGKYRPGHFEGVAHVVHNLFHFVKPTKAYFGLKDYQQFAVIKKMVKTLGLPVEPVGCNTYRNKAGLALSSRNKNLNTQQIEESLIIIETLNFVKENQNRFNINDLKQEAIRLFNKGNLTLEYLDIVHAESFKELNEIDEKAVCCIAAYSEKVRLIDNILL